MNKNKISEQKLNKLKETLKNTTVGWEKDGCIPANLVMRNGLGVKLAEVNRWCGGFQDPQYPRMIGWKVEKVNSSVSVNVFKNIIMVKSTKNMRANPKQTNAAWDLAIGKATQKALRQVEDIVSVKFPNLVYCDD